MTNRIEIYDTTLRDGTQGEAINFSVADKVRIALALDALGIDFAFSPDGKTLAVAGRSRL